MSAPAVVARVFGGLGNQLFIYAFARALAERNRVPLRLDIRSNFSRDRKYGRTFLLDHIVAPVAYAGRAESRFFPGGRTLRSIERRINARLPLASRYHVDERSQCLDTEIRDMRIVRRTVFNGYWQAPGYFTDLQPAITGLVRFPAYLTDPLANEQAAIQGANAVCLAIRRFEETPGPKQRILQTDYFTRAMASMEQQVANPHYFVFAQDMDWARAHIRSTHPVTYANRKDLHTGAIQDLYLMTRCRHYILSNSTLHWWAAWLGGSDDAVVIAPGDGWSNRDVLPDHWQRL